MTIKDREEYSVAFLFSEQNDWIFEYYSADLFEDVWQGQLFHSFDPKQLVGFDVLFVLGYTRILSAEFLKQNSLTLVIHESALPAGKGFAPLQWQILEGKNAITVTLFEATEKADSGDIILQEQLLLKGTELYREIRKKQAECTFKIVAKFLADYPVFSKTSQIGVESRYPRRRVADSELSVNSTIGEQFDLLRIGNNDGWPSFFHYRGQKYIVEIQTEDSWLKSKKSRRINE